MGTYRKIRKYSSDVHIYEFKNTEERLDATIGTYKKLEKLSKINGEPKSDERVIAKINGGFFAMNGSTEYIGSFVDEGLYYQKAEEFYPTLIYWKKDNKLTIEHQPTQSRHAYYQSNAWWAIGVPWTLVIDGKQNFIYSKQTLIEVFGHPYQRAPRTLLGQKKDGTIVMVVVDGRKTSTLGVTIEQSAAIMIELGCYIAVNLDGGGSSEMIVDGAIKNRPSDGVERSIGTAFMVYAKSKNIKNPYAVPTHNLRRGSKGTAVKWLQYELKFRGYDIGSLGIDGDFGKATDAAVRQYQKDYNLGVDGIVGPATRASLRSR
jgi:exopolysaccharide biosynthesis protein